MDDVQHKSGEVPPAQQLTSTDEKTKSSKGPGRAFSNTKETWEKKRRSETHAAELWLFDVARNHEESWNIIHTHSLVGLYFKKEEVINVF